MVKFLQESVSMTISPTVFWKYVPLNSLPKPSTCNVRNGKGYDQEKFKDSNSEKKA